MLKDRIIRANDLRENRQTTEVRRNWLSLFFNKTWRAVLKMFSRLYKIAASEALPPPPKKKKKKFCMSKLMSHVGAVRKKAQIPFWDVSA